MQRTAPLTTTDESANEDVRRAEAAVGESVKRFDEALDHLAEKVDLSSAKVHAVTERIDQTKKTVRRVQAFPQLVVDSARPLVKRTWTLASERLQMVRENPQPLLLRAGLFFGSAVLIAGWQRARQRH